MVWEISTQRRKAVFFDTQGVSPHGRLDDSFAQVVDADFTVVIVHGPGGIQPGNIPNTSGLDRSFPYPCAGPRDYIELEASDSPAETLFPGEYMCPGFSSQRLGSMAGPLDDNGNPINRGTWVPLQSITWAFVSSRRFACAIAPPIVTGFAWANGKSLGADRYSPYPILGAGGKYNEYAFSNTAVFPQWTKILR